MNSMKVVSWNVNGLRSIYKKGFLKWLTSINADIVCLQEIKAQLSQIPQDLIRMNSYHSFFSSGIRKGHSGVAVYSREKPLKTEDQLGLARFDQEGRMIKLKYADFWLFNFYFPHGGRDKNQLDYKLSVYDCLLDYLENYKDQKVILIGDFNVAHEEIDLARPKQNHQNIMFTDEEREHLDRLISLGFVDSFRKFHREGGNYTWWPYHANARARNLGWRIDYVFVSKGLAPELKKAFILPEVKGSDHCPVGIET